MSNLYRLVVAQLQDDGFPAAATSVASATGTAPLALPAKPLEQALKGKHTGLLGQYDIGQYHLRSMLGGLSAKTSRFSHDGRHVAIGCDDGTVHVFESDTLTSGRMANPSVESAVRQYGDHSDAVNDVVFHPSALVLVTASEDARLQFYDHTQPRAGPARTCTDTHPIRSADFHPLGEHLLVGTTHAALHLYDCATFRCFLSAVPSHHHRAAITDARWASDGSLFASCAAGEAKLWDGHSCACIATLSRPHGGTPVGSVVFSKDGRHLLTSGADSAMKLWDVRMVRQAAAGRAVPSPVRTYEGGGCSSARRSTALSHDEAVVIGADEGSSTALVWAANNGAALSAGGLAGPAGAGADAESRSYGEVVAKCTGHSAPIRSVAHAPHAPAFVSCAEDGQLRAWAM